MIKNGNLKKRFIGCDEDGDLFLERGRIYRGIHRGKGKIYRNILSICIHNRLFDIGIVKTEEIKLKDNNFLKKYDLLLKHEKIPIVSYPHEWSSEMLKEAAIFHLDLFNKLNKFGLTLKDWHPLNILFYGTKPVFVDFTSIIPAGKLHNQAYLKFDFNIFKNILWDDYSYLYNEMYLKMFLPYFLLPLYYMKYKKFQMVRKRMLETTLNTSRDVIKVNEVFGSMTLIRLIFEIKELFRKTTLIEKGCYKNNLISYLIKEINNIIVDSYRGSYIDYYTAKKESFDFDDHAFWTNKQNTVFNLLGKYKPKTVLDIGSNTGWYSLLAAKQGSSVVALDIDESCINALYNIGQKENLKILPLFMDILNIPNDIYPDINKNNIKNGSLSNRSYPILLSPQKRFKSDMVFVLALLHHLCLGYGKNFTQILKIINPFVSKLLILEFVSLEDKMIQNEPSFFTSYQEKRFNFDWYNFKNLHWSLSKYYKKIEVFKSHPNTRKIIVCQV